MWKDVWTDFIKVRMSCLPLNEAVAWADHLMTMEKSRKPSYLEFFNPQHLRKNSKSTSSILFVKIKSGRMHLQGQNDFSKKGRKYYLWPNMEVYPYFELKCVFSLFMLNLPLLDSVVIPFTHRPRLQRWEVFWWEWCHLSSLFVKGFPYRLVIERGWLVAKIGGYFWVWKLGKTWRQSHVLGDPENGKSISLHSWLILEMYYYAYDTSENITATREEIVSV